MLVVYFVWKEEEYVYKILVEKFSYKIDVEVEWW